MNILNRIANIGVESTISSDNKRYISITNKVSLLVALFTFFLAIVSFTFFGPINSVKGAFLFSVVFLLPVLINQIGHTNTSRVLLSILLSISSIIVSLIDKLDSFVLEELQYFEFRLTLVCASLFPFIVFKIAEKRYWVPAISINFLCLVLYDPIHNYFNLGYYQLGLSSPNYLFMNFMFTACFFILVGCTYFLKNSFELYEKDNQLLITELSQRQEEILKANATINNQKLILTKENLILNKELVDKNNQLIETNSELIQHNNDLQQFSYTVSHNLRGPVASLLGLISLADTSSFGEGNQDLFDHIKKSATSLDVIIKDLGNIIDIRNSVTKVKQYIDFQEEVNHIITLLQKEILDHKVQIKCDFELVSDAYSVKSMVNSILYNLVSNAIKYRSPERQAKILIRTEKVDNHIKISVTDNGLGIDTVKFKEKIFGLYKRFHTHVDGKGLGLFLVKLQAESLGGSVEIESEPGRGSKMSVYISNMLNPDHQVIMEEEWGKLYFDAPKNISMVIWKRALTVNEFREFFHACAEFNKAQNCPNWIAQIQQGTKAESNNEEYDKARMQFANQLKRTSLKRLGYVIPVANEPPDFEQYKMQLTAFYQGRIQFFRTIEEAQLWIAMEELREVEKKIA